MTRAAGTDSATSGVMLDEVTSRIRTIGGAAAAAPRVMDLRRIDVSSTEIRERVRKGQAIRGFVIDAVAQYIEFNGLYR